MEISNYKAEIIGGKHIAQPETRLSNLSSGLNGTWSPWSPWSAWSSSSPNIFGNKDRSYVEMKDGDHYSISLYNGHSTRCHAKITIDGKPVGTWILEPWATVRLERPVDLAKKFTFFKVNSAGGSEAGLVRGDSKNGLVSIDFIPEVGVRTNFFESNLDRCLGRASRDFRSRDDDDNDDDILGFDGRRPCNSSLGMMQGYNTGGRKGVRGLGARSAQFRSTRGLDCSPSNQMESCTSLDYEAGGTGLQGRSDQDFRVSHERLELDHTAKVTINLRLIARKDPVDYERITPLGSVFGPRSNPVPPPIF